MGKEEGKKLTNNDQARTREEPQNQKEGASPSPSERRGCAWRNTWFGQKLELFELLKKQKSLGEMRYSIRKRMVFKM